MHCVSTFLILQQTPDPGNAGVGRGNKVKCTAR
jgi:hypothetical protein